MDLASKVEAIEKYLGMSGQSDQLYEQQTRAVPASVDTGTKITN